MKVDVRDQQLNTIGRRYMLLGAWLCGWALALALALSPDTPVRLLGQTLGLVLLFFVARSIWKTRR